MNMKSMSMYSTQYLVGAPFAWITAAMWRGMELISLWHCSGVMRAQVALIVAFSSSSLLGLAYRIFLFTIPHRFFMGLRSGEFAGQLRTGIPWKWNLHLHKVGQQQEAWSALKLPGIRLCWPWTSENTVDQHQQMTWHPKPSLTVETLHWTSSNVYSVPLLSFSRLWDPDFQRKCKIYFHQRT